MSIKTIESPLPIGQFYRKYQKQMAGIALTWTSVNSTILARIQIQMEKLFLGVIVSIPMALTIVSKHVTQDKVQVLFSISKMSKISCII